MVNVFSIEKDIRNCRTAKQVKALLSRHGITVHKDDTADACGISNIPITKALNLWLDETTRVYYTRHGYQIQKWKKGQRKVAGSRRYRACDGLVQTRYDYDVTEYPDTSEHQRGGLRNGHI